MAGRAGSGTLYIAEASWKHSLIPRESAAGILRESTVPVVALSDVISEAVRLNGRIVVKLDIEGAECEAVLETHPSVWSRVEEVFVETHAFSSCTHGDLLDHLGRAEFVVLRRPAGRTSLFHLARCQRGA